MVYLSTNDSDNETTKFLSPLEPDHQQWLGLIILESVFLVIGVYLLVAFIYHTAKLFFAKSRSSPPCAISLRRFRNMLLCLLIFYAITSVFKFSLAQWVYWGSTTSKALHQCDVNDMLFQAAHAIGTTSLLFFLWLRQHSLQQGAKCFAQPSSHIMRFSWFIFAVILVGGIGATVGLLFSSDPYNLLLIKGTNACTYPSAGANSIIAYTGYSLLVILQGCILFLFVYILRKILSENFVWNCQASRNQSTMAKQKKKQENTSKLIRNCTIAAAISSASNIIVVAIDVIYKGKMAQLTVHAVWDIDNAISLACIVFCFSNWNQLLLPWPCFEKMFQDKLWTINPSNRQEV